LADSHKGGLDGGRRHHRTEDVEGLCLGKRRIVPQDVRWGLVQVRRARGGPKKVKRST